MSERVAWVVLDRDSADFYVTQDEYRSIPGFAETWARAYCAGLNRNEDERPYRVIKRTTATNGTITEEVINDA